jgi:putative transposase
LAVELPSWSEAVAGGWLEDWAVNLMLVNMATRKFARATHLAGAGVPATSIHNPPFPVDSTR